MQAVFYPVVKRAFDVVLAGVIVVVTLPLSVAVAASVAVFMGRPVLFRQWRPGRDGELFEMVKFRTMRDGGGSDSERLTPLGRFLRSTSLDELPELWNVLRGDMSLVGPRPLLPQYRDLYTLRQARRHEMRPGVTGLAQVNGRNTVDWDERLDLDVRYIEQASLWLDLRILGRTVATVVSRDGVSAEGEATMPLFTGSASTEARGREPVEAPR